MKHYTLSSATPIGGNTVFLAIAKRYTTFFSASRHFSHIINNLGSSGGKTFLGKQKPRWCPFKI
jgi:hypothetical protein